jgi:hypothetical protein
MKLRRWIGVCLVVTLSLSLSLHDLECGGRFA